MAQSYQIPRARASNEQIFTEDENIELSSRMMVRQGFKGALVGRLETDLLNDLAKTSFENIYPTPPTRKAETQIVPSIPPGYRPFGLDRNELSPFEAVAVCQSLHAALLHLSQTCTVSVPPSRKILI